MRTHIDIIDAAGGPSALAKVIKVDANTVKAWKRIGSIPAAHFTALAEAGLASLEELAAAAAARRAA